MNKSALYATLITVTAVIIIVLSFIYPAIGAFLPMIPFVALFWGILYILFEMSELDDKL